MTEISDSLRLLFETSLEQRGDHYVIPIPNELVEQGSLTEGESYRVALLSALDEHPRTTTSQPERQTADVKTAASSGPAPDQSTSPGRHPQKPPVKEGDVRSVTIDTLGDQGDGIAKVERGFIVIVSDTQPGDQVDVEITDVKDTVAFAEPIGEATVR